MKVPVHAGKPGIPFESPSTPPTPTVTPTDQQWDARTGSAAPLALLQRLYETPAATEFFFPEHLNKFDDELPASWRTQQCAYCHKLFSVNLAPPPRIQRRQERGMRSFVEQYEDNHVRPGECSGCASFWSWADVTFNLPGKWSLGQGPADARVPSQHPVKEAGSEDAGSDVLMCYENPVHWDDEKGPKGKSFMVQRDLNPSPTPNSAVEPMRTTAAEAKEVFYPLRRGSLYCEKGIFDALGGSMPAHTLEHKEAQKNPALRHELKGGHVAQGSALHARRM